MPIVETDGYHLMQEMPPQLFPINSDSEVGRQFLQRVGERHGASLAAAAKLPTRLFALASPLAPGLAFAGAEAMISSFLSDAPTMMSSAGTGLGLEDAVASCLGETIERLSQAERRGDIKMRAPIVAAGSACGGGMAELIAEIAIGIGLPSGLPVDWVVAQDFSSQRSLLVPADWCLRRATDGPLRMGDTPLSIGVAAGPSLEAASTSAILELIERDAVAQWWIGGRHGRAIGLESLGAAGAHDLIDHVRRGQQARTSWFIDITTDVPVPTVVAVSAASDGKSVACGMAARLSLRDAIRASVFEMCQMELALLVVHLKRRQRGDAALNVVDRQHLARATTIDASRCSLLHPAGVARSVDRQAGDDSLQHLRQLMSNAHLDVALVDLTRPEYAVPVIAAIAPGLQLFPCSVQTVRLKRTISQTGGGDQWTGGIALA